MELIWFSNSFWTTVFISSVEQFITDKKFGKDLIAITNVEYSFGLSQ